MPVLPVVALLLALAAAPQDGAVLGGLDPVDLCAGRETPGRQASTLERDGRLYRFASDENRARFEAEPERYAVQLGGGCGRMGPLSASCSGDRFAVHEGRIYLFASDACRASFLAAPAKFIDRDDPPLLQGEPDAASVERGRALLARVLEGLGGAQRVDAVRALRLEKRGVDRNDGKEHSTRDERTWRLPDDLRHQTAWDEWVYTYVVTAEDAFSGGKQMQPLTSAARRELRRQLGREPLWLLRHRDDPGFTVAAGGTDTVGETATELLRVRYEDATTTWWVDPVSGRILRSAWRGRLGDSAIGEVIVDASDFRETGGLLLPHAREVRFDGQRDETASGLLDVVEVDPALSDEAFRRSG